MPHILEPLYNALRFQRNPLQLLKYYVRQDERIAPFKLLTKQCYIVRDAQLIHEILLQRGLSSGSADFLRGGQGMDVVRAIVGGDGLLTTEGEDWKTKRKRMAPVYHHKIVSDFGAIFLQGAREYLVGWAALDHSNAIDIEFQMTDLTMINACKALFGSDITEHDRTTIAQGVQVVNTYFAARFLLPLPGWIPTPLNRQFRRAVRHMNEVTDRLIRTRRGQMSGGVEQQRDLLALLMHSENEGHTVTNEQIHTEVLTALLAGHGTTAAALCWIWYMLALPENAQHAERLLHELEALPNLPTVDEISALPFLGQIINESLRLWPPVWFSFRETAHPVEIAGQHIQKGAMLFISPYLLHRDPRCWGENAEEFDPSRFAPEATVPSDAYLPFLSGPHVCIGQGFALLHLRIIVALLFRSYSFHISPEQLPTPAFLSTLVPATGMWLRISARQGQNVASEEASML